jgi:5-methylcytosine-specific restriction endonuclease McrA
VPLKACISRMKKLKEFDYELTMKEAGSKEQRKLMSSELKNKIKIRDDYTCQICGKHMPDEVGLHIDHIIPVAKGGLSIEKNLRVLCSKCNGKKGSKIE